LTSDDKTIVVAYRRNKILSSEKIIYQEADSVVNVEKIEKVKSPLSINDSNKTSIKTKEIIKDPLNQASKYILIGKFLASLVIAALLFFAGLSLYQWKEGRENKNAALAKEEMVKSKDTERFDATASTKPVEDVASSNQDTSKQTPDELLKNGSKNFDAAQEKVSPNSVTGELKKSLPK